MTPTEPLSWDLQSLVEDDFLYFFLRLRKHRVRALVQNLQARYPEESREQLARRLIASHSQLSFLGGTLLHLPTILPGLGQLWQTLGFVGGTSALTRMHIYLILEIALIYGKDIDDQARVREIAAVVAATGAAAAAPVVTHLLGVTPLISLPLAGLTAVTLTQMIGDTAMQYYAASLDETAQAPAPTAQPI
jgi:uncharacterized protein (DUF697 family)